MLVGASGQDLGVGALVDDRQAPAILALFVVAAFFIDRKIAVEQNHLTAGAQAGLAVGALQLDGGPLDARGLHLRGDHPLPDQLIEPA